MKSTAHKFLSALALVAGFAAAGSAHAVWQFTSASSATSDPAATMTSMSGARFTNATTAGGGFASGATWSTQALNYHSPGVGIGTDSSSAPQHAIDNNGFTEALLVGFSNSVSLSSIGLSYTHNGTSSGVQVDLSLFRWVGGASGPSLHGSAAGATMTGWELVGNYGDMVVDTTSPYNLVNSTAKGSSWWLISAYNSGFSGAGETRGGLDNGNDYFKIYALAGSACTDTSSGNKCNNTTTQVAEPGSLALAGVALLGAVGLRRRRKS